MHWNDMLYLYAQKNGGEYFGANTNDDLFGASYGATLLLEHKGAPMLVRCEEQSAGRGGCYHVMRVLLRCELERDYILRIGAKTAVRKGVNAVLDQLDKGVERLAPKVDLFRDYGYPEVTGGRAIKTSDREFTQMVFRELDFRSLLLEQPKNGVAVYPCAPPCTTGALHLVEASAYLDGVNSGWETGETDVWDSPEQRRQALENTNFDQQLDALIRLAKAALGAVTAWRMPEKRIDK